MLGLMRVLHVSSSFPLNEGDTTAPFMEEITRALAGRGHQVRVVVPHVRALVTGQRRGVELTSYRYAPRPLQTWGYGRSLRAGGAIRPSALAAAPLAILAMLAKTRREIGDWKPGILHLHWLLPQGIVGLVAPPYLPVVVSLHGADVGAASSSTLLGLVAKAALHRADHLVAASGEMIERVAVLDPSVRDRSSIIPHGANGALFRPGDRKEARRHLNVDSQGPILLAVGRLVPKKGFEYLIRSLSLLNESTAHLYIAGEGSLRQVLTTIAESQCPGRVTFLGNVERSRLADWYAASDLVMVPSVRTARDIDSGPVVLTEAMASGRGVISTPVGMAPDIVKNGYNGFLVPEANPEALATAIHEAIAHVETLGTNARQTFERVGDWSRVASQLQRVYEMARTKRRMVEAGD